MSGCDWTNKHNEEMAKISNKKEATEWLNILLAYTGGGKEYDGKVLVCESHPRRPWNMGYLFDCNCGGPGMPPISRKQNI